MEYNSILPDPSSVVNMKWGVGIEYEISPAFNYSTQLSGKSTVIYLIRTLAYLPKRRANRPGEF